jgi:small subunit ribosomal protein S21
MITVILKEGEYIDSAMRRLKRIVEKAGIPKELRQRKRYEKPTKKRQRKISASKARQVRKKKNEQQQKFTT